ncbi:hypothetical protein [Salinibacter grassmerensis]|uniref:hypothetical protein n=1 Tax=Salinibacter grassmerensis TaxID=3040353 RepID=UPI0021E7ADB4|nr:hypothetical protein [Salinibacter grassmerensis]
MSALVFDSNVYRNLFRELDFEEARDLGTKLSKKQSEQGDTSYAQLYVVCELLSHLADTSDPAFGDCRHAILGLWNHCLQESKEMMRFIPDPELQFAKEFYGEIDDQYGALYNNVMYLCKEVNERGESDELTDIRGNLSEVSRAIEMSEANFVDDVLRQVVNHTDPNASNWQIFEDDEEAKSEILSFLNSEDSDVIIGISNALRFRDAAGVGEESPDEIRAKGKYLAENYKVPMKMYKEILKRIVETGCDLTKKNRANWLWDMQISFFLGPNNHVQGEHLVLVTDDGDILDAADEAGASNYVMELSHYRSSVGV